MMNRDDEIKRVKMVVEVVMDIRVRQGNVAEVAERKFEQMVAEERGIVMWDFHNGSGVEVIG